MRLQSFRARAVPDYFRAADHRALRLRSRIAVPRAPPRLARRGNPGALGPFPRHQSQHAPRQPANVPRRLCDPLELPLRPVPPQGLNPELTLRKSERQSPLPPPFFVTAHSKGVTDAIFVSADSKEVTDRQLPPKPGKTGCLLISAHSKGLRVTRSVVRGRGREGTTATPGNSYRCQKKLVTKL